MTETKESFQVVGLGGAKRLQGSIAIAGSKNAALPAFASTLLFKEPVTLANVPAITDILKTRSLLEYLGATVTRADDRYTIDTHTLTGTQLEPETAKKFRASVIFTGPLLARSGEVRFVHPGGCVIGARPIDVFVSGFQKMGARVTETETELVVVAPRGGLVGADIVFRVPSVTATEALMMAAVLATGTTQLINVAMEPEVTALATFLNACGASIEGIGTPTLTITGTEGKLLEAREAYVTIPDRLEAGSFLILGALCANKLSITQCDPRHLTLPLEMMRQAGVPIETEETAIHILERNGTIANDAFTGLHVRTHEYPGFPTDLQAPMTVFLTQVSGESVVEEMIFEGRLSYTEDVVRMGADIDIAHPHRAVIHGPRHLVGRELYSPDLRAGLAYIIAALVAKGTSVIHNIHYIDRGYEQVEEKLKGIGADITRMTT